MTFEQDTDRTDLVFAACKVDYGSSSSDGGGSSTPTNDAPLDLTTTITVMSQFQNESRGIVLLHEDGPGKEYLLAKKNLDGQ